MFVIHIEDQVYFSCHPTQTVLGLLWPTYLCQHRPYHCVYHKIKNDWRRWVALQDTLTRPKLPTQELPCLGKYFMLLPVLAKEAGQIYPQTVPPQDLKTSHCFQHITSFSHVQENLKKRLMGKPGQLLIQLGLKGRRPCPTPLLKPM